jgi:hypothetical protein
MTREENLVGLMAVNRDVLAQVEMPCRTDRGRSLAAIRHRE